MLTDETEPPAPPTAAPEKAAGLHLKRRRETPDVARTYLLLSLKDRKRAELYMDLFCEKTGTEKRYVQGWLPVVAAAQLAYKRPEEKELLESWINVFEYQ